ncbi:hypothetical protein FACS189443_6860 [Planctomycetales bacterium]|nr:hypothetical protein FACS189443_6860 [Planctomycetales bacterium]
MLDDFDAVGDKAPEGHVLDAVFDSWGRLSLSTRSEIADRNPAKQNPRAYQRYGTDRRGKYSFPVEKIVGIAKGYTRGAERLISFAVTKSSYE